jgi:hypothetical protein
VSDTAWRQYAELARRLDGIRSVESIRTATVREDRSGLQEQYAALEARVTDQGGRLLGTADWLHLRRPKLDPLAPAPDAVAGDPAGVLARLEEALDRGEAELAAAAHRGERPGLLPHVGDTTRGLLVYGAAALLVLLAQAVAFVRAGDHAPDFVTVMIVIPALGFAAAFLALFAGGRSRVVRGAATSLTRFGFLLCFLVGPAAFVVLLLTSR